ncbi:MAG: RnfABCDGE type electron transport complex subunit D [Patescibacteria group bacterium]
MKLIDKLLDGITMYRLLLYYLLCLLGAAMLLGAFGYVSYSPQSIAATAAYLTLLCWLLNKLFARAFEAPVNPESSLITALILSLIITPQLSTQNFIFLSIVAMLAIGSKYILVIRKQHIFNPAAIAILLTSLCAGKSASWWVGTTWLLPIVIAGGLLIVRKIQRFQMVAAFLMTSMLATLAFSLINHTGVGLTVKHIILNSSLLFLAFVMLTEPLTSPTTRRNQAWYGGLAGLLFPPQLNVLGIYSSPELVLAISNVSSYIVSPKAKLLPKLSQKLSWGSATKDFIFTSDQKFTYKPGQYMEWTLPHAKADERGSRRYFTLASSPTEDNIRLGVKFYKEGSSFKRAMRAMEVGNSMAAGQLSGDFVLPKDSSKKLVFIAGGIGITPFRSMLKYLTDTYDVRPVTLLYSERNPEAAAYHDVINDAGRQLGTKTVYTFTDMNLPDDNIRKGRIDSALIATEVPDYLECLFYISGPHPMVSAIKADLKNLGVKDQNIKIDFFPGYA